MGKSDFIITQKKKPCNHLCVHVYLIFAPSVFQSNRDIVNYWWKRGHSEGIAKFEKLTTCIYMYTSNMYKCCINCTATVKSKVFEMFHIRPWSFVWVYFSTVLNLRQHKKTRCRPNVSSFSQWKSLYSSFQLASFTDLHRKFHHLHRKPLFADNGDASLHDMLVRSSLSRPAIHGLLPGTQPCSHPLQTCPFVSHSTHTLY